MTRLVLAIPFFLLPALALESTTGDTRAGPGAGGMRRGPCGGRGERADGPRAECGPHRGPGRGGRAAAAEDSERGRGAGRGRARQDDRPGHGRGHGRGAGRAGRGSHGRGIGDGSCRLAQTGAEAWTDLQPAPAEFLMRLHEALRRERIAEATYRMMAERWPRPRRWSNLARAEARHRDAVAALLRAWGESPDLESALELPAFTTPAEASAVAVGIEETVIGIYEALLAGCPDPRARDVLGNIQQANRNHLRAASD